MTIIYQLLQLCLLICMRIQQSIFVIILKVSTLIVRSAVLAFTDKFRRPINRLLQVALYFLLLVLIVDSYFALFMRLFLSGQECTHLMGKIMRLPIMQDQLLVCITHFSIPDIKI